MINNVTVPAIYDKLELMCTDSIVRIILYYRPLHYNSSDLDYLS